jgi:hypothetical protein
MKNLFIAVVLLLIFNLSMAQIPLFQWAFDSSESTLKTDSIRGLIAFNEGVSGKSLVFDGYSTEVIRKAPEHMPAESFTITAWIAPQEYSWNISAIINQQKDFKSGFLFGINQIGKLVAGISIDNEWKTFVSAYSVPLLKWSFVALKYERNNGITFFINGKEAGENAFSGTPDYAEYETISIGKTQTKMPPAYIEPKTTPGIKTWMRFDGLIDELKLFGKALCSNEVSTIYGSVKVGNKQPCKTCILARHGLYSRDGF